MLTTSQPFKHSQTSATNAMKNRGKLAASEHRIGMKSGNLSSTLEKLYVWERKLYKEVKVHHVNSVALLVHIYQKGCYFLFDPCALIFFMKQNL